MLHAPLQMCISLPAQKIGLLNHERINCSWRKVAYCVLNGEAVTHAETQWAVCSESRHALCLYIVKDWLSPSYPVRDGPGLRCSSRRHGQVTKSHSHTPSRLLCEWLLWGSLYLVVFNFFSPFISSVVGHNLDITGLRIWLGKGCPTWLSSLWTWVNVAEGQNTGQPWRSESFVTGIKDNFAKMCWEKFQ